MKHRTFFPHLSLAVALLSGNALQAEVTADQVWESWTAYYASTGMVVTTGDPQRSGDTLLIPGVSFSSVMPEGNMSITLGDVTLRELGDGTVEVTMPDEMPITVVTEPATGETVTIPFTFRAPGMTTLVSGDPGSLNFDNVAPEMTVSLSSIDVDGQTIELGVDITLKGSRNQYRMIDSDLTEVTAIFSADELTYAVSATDPEGSGGYLRVNGKLVGISGNSDLAIPQGIDSTDGAALIKAGMRIALALNHKGSSFDIDFQDGEQSAKITGGSGGGGLDMSFSSEAMAYGLNSTDASFSMVASDLPFPADISIAETSFRVAMPMAMSDVPKPAALVLRVVDLSVPEEIWGMVDPGGQFSHDPATIIVDASGMVRWLVDILDPEGMESVAMPAEVSEFALNELTIALVGASLTGAGSFTFDNADLSMGFPKPLGKVDVTVTGANALMDKLVAMGMLPEDQVMGARMMMGMFAVPTGDDELSSTIEYREDGGLYANGQRLQ